MAYFNKWPGAGVGGGVVDLLPACERERRKKVSKALLKGA